MREPLELASLQQAEEVPSGASGRFLRPGLRPSGAREVSGGRRSLQCLSKTQSEQRTSKKRVRLSLAALDSKPAHLVYQSGSRYSHPCGSPVRSSEHPVGFAQHLHDMIALRIVQ
jgi:hypothetical protein